MQYHVSPNDIQLKSSFKVKKETFAQELAKIREKHPKCRVWKRSLLSLKLEWAAHNALYALGVLRDRTRYGSQLAPALVYPARLRHYGRAGLAVHQVGFRVLIVANPDSLLYLYRQNKPLETHVYTH